MPTFSIDLTAQQATRLAAAFGKFFNLVDEAGAPRAATTEEVKAYMRHELKKIVLIQERADAEAAIVAPEF